MFRLFGYYFRAWSRVERDPQNSLSSGARQLSSPDPNPEFWRCQLLKMKTLTQILSSGQQLKIRPLTRPDVIEIVRIRHHESLRPFQYQPDASFEKRLNEIVDAYEQSEIACHAFNAVILDGQTIGDICMNGWGQRLDFSWNLSPEFWGNGIMPRALELVFDQRFASNDNLVIRADVFPNNSRNIRMMKKLGFQPIVHSRIRMWIWDLVSRHSRKVLRFRMTKSDFESRLESNGEISLSATINGSTSKPNPETAAELP